LFSQQIKQTSRVDMLQREQIWQTALTWEGTPYHDCQCLKHVGVDCGNLIVGVAKEVGALALEYRLEPYAPERHLHQREDLMSPLLTACGCTPVPWEARQPGDVLTFRFGLTVSHAAFLLPDNELVHAVVDKGVVRQALVGSWVALHDRAWCFPGVEAMACH
jgi:cell wall-associated NlpC family hydrolase